MDFTNDKLMVGTSKLFEQKGYRQNGQNGESFEYLVAARA